MRTMWDNQTIINNVNEEIEKVWKQFPNEKTFISDVCLNEGFENQIYLRNLWKPNIFEPISLNGLKGTNFQRALRYAIEKRYGELLNNSVKLEYPCNSKNIIQALKTTNFESWWCIMLYFSSSSVYSTSIAPYLQNDDRNILLDKFKVMDFRLYNIDLSKDKSLFVLINRDVPFLKRSEKETRIVSCQKKLYSYAPSHIDYNLEISTCLELACNKNMKAIEIIIDDTKEHPIKPIENIFVKH